MGGTEKSQAFVGISLYVKEKAARLQLLAEAP